MSTAKKLWKKLYAGGASSNQADVFFFGLHQGGRGILTCKSYFFLYEPKAGTDFFKSALFQRASMLHF